MKGSQRTLSRLASVACQRPGQYSVPDLGSVVNASQRIQHAGRRITTRMRGSCEGDQLQTTAMAAEGA
jgi:hypothetical protein